MIIAIESIFLCIIFTIIIAIAVREPIKSLFNYPPKIQERVKSLDQYKDKVPTQENKIYAKTTASILFLIILICVLKFVNGCTSFIDSLLNGFLLWTIVNLYDVVVLDIIWFCHSKKFIFEGTEDMVDEYHNYWYHIKGFFIGEVLGLIICSLAGLIINYIN